VSRHKVPIALQRQFAQGEVANMQAESACGVKEKEEDFMIGLT